MAHRLLIAGVGNIFLGDDGFGVEVVRLLRHQSWPEEVVISDFGIRGFDLALAFLEPWECVILADAYAHGANPGDLCVIEPDLEGDVAGGEGLCLDGHSLHPLAVFHLVRQMGGPLPPIRLVGCEPGNISEEAGIGLSEQVKPALGKAVTIIEQLVQEVIFKRQKVKECTSFP
jgi:hydrogenase maturation protease